MYARNGEFLSFLMKILLSSTLCGVVQWQEFYLIISFNNSNVISYSLFAIFQYDKQRMLFWLKANYKPQIIWHKSKSKMQISEFIYFFRQCFDCNFTHLSETWKKVIEINENSQQTSMSCPNILSPKKAKIV